MWGWATRVGVQLGATRLTRASLSVVLKRLLPCSGQASPTLPLPTVAFLTSPTVTPPSVQPVSPPTVVSTSLAADLEGLTLTDAPLVPSVSEIGLGHSSVLRPLVSLCIRSVIEGVTLGGNKAGTGSSCSCLHPTSTRSSSC